MLSQGAGHDGSFYGYAVYIRAKTSSSAHQKAAFPERDSR